MEFSGSRQVSIIVNDLEGKLRTVQTTQIPDDQTLNHLESFVNEYATQLEHLQSSSDPTFVAQLLPSLLQMIISLSKICSEKSDFIQTGVNLSGEKLRYLISQTKNLHNQIKEYIKSSKLSIILSKSSEQRPFCHHLCRVSDFIGNTDVVTTLICQKLIVKLITGTTDEQSSQVKMEEINDGLATVVYQRVLQQMSTICSKNMRDKNDPNRESPTIKMYVIYLQMLLKLIQYSGTIAQLNNYREFFRIIIQLHQCLENTCEQNRFQLEFYNSTTILQEILQEFVQYALNCQLNVFVDDLCSEMSSNPSKYGSLIVLFRLIEALDCTWMRRASPDCCLYWIDRLLTSLFNLIDQCQFQLVLPALVPICFNKSQVEYGSLYDIAYSQLMKFVHHQSMQTLTCSMTHLLEQSNDFSIVSTSIQLTSEVILQCYYLYQNSSDQFQQIFSLFLAELLRLDAHRSLVQYLLNMPNIKSMKSRIYQTFLSSDRFQDVYQLFSSSLNLINMNSTLHFPNQIDHLYAFVRLYQTELSSQQIQHAFDTCLYSIQQFLSLPILTETTCKHFQFSIRLLNSLIFPPNFEPLKCLLGQLTQIFVLLDEQTALDIRIEFLHLFSTQINHLDEQDLGRIFDYLLTCPLEPNSSSSLGFHLTSLDFLDSSRQRSPRTAQITDLIIQLIVRYGNENSPDHLFKSHLMRIFRNYICNGNDNSLVMRVKSQCALLRSNIDEFEKSIKTLGSSIIWHNFPSQNILLQNNDNEKRDKLKLYRTLFAECQSESCSSSQAMQQD